MAGYEPHKATRPGSRPSAYSNPLLSASLQVDDFSARIMPAASPIAKLEITDNAELKPVIYASGADQAYSMSSSTAAGAAAETFSDISLAPSTTQSMTASSSMADMAGQSHFLNPLEDLDAFDSRSGFAGGQGFDKSSGESQGLGGGNTATEMLINQASSITTNLQQALPAVASTVFSHFSNYLKGGGPPQGHHHRAERPMDAQSGYDQPQVVQQQYVSPLDDIYHHQMSNPADTQNQMPLFISPQDAPQVAPPGGISGSGGPPPPPGGQNSYRIGGQKKKTYAPPPVHGFSTHGPGQFTPGYDPTAPMQSGANVMPPTGMMGMPPPPMASQQEVVGSSLNPSPLPPIRPSSVPQQQEMMPPTAPQYPSQQTTPAPPAAAPPTMFMPPTESFPQQEPPITVFAPPPFAQPAFSEPPFSQPQYQPVPVQNVNPEPEKTSSKFSISSFFTNNSILDRIQGKSPQPEMTPNSHYGGYSDFGGIATGSGQYGQYGQIGQLPPMTMPPGQSQQAPPPAFVNPQMFNANPISVDASSQPPQPAEGVNSAIGFFNPPPPSQVQQPPPNVPMSTGSTFPPMEMTPTPMMPPMQDPQLPPKVPSSSAGGVGGGGGYRMNKGRPAYANPNLIAQSSTTSGFMAPERSGVPPPAAQWFNPGAAESAPVVEQQSGNPLNPMANSMFMNPGGVSEVPQQPGIFNPLANPPTVTGGINNPVMAPSSGPTPPPPVTNLFTPLGDGNSVSGGSGQVVPPPISTFPNQPPSMKDNTTAEVPPPVQPVLFNPSGSSSAATPMPPFTTSLTPQPFMPTFFTPTAAPINEVFAPPPVATIAPNQVPSPLINAAGIPEKMFQFIPAPVPAVQAAPAPSTAFFDSSFLGSMETTPVEEKQSSGLKPINFFNTFSAAASPQDIVPPVIAAVPPSDRPEHYLFTSFAPPAPELPPPPPMMSVFPPSATVVDNNANNDVTPSAVPALPENDGVVESNHNNNNTALDGGQGDQAEVATLNLNDPPGAAAAMTTTAQLWSDENANLGGAAAMAPNFFMVGREGTGQQLREEDSLNTSEKAEDINAHFFDSPPDVKPTDPIANPNFFKSFMKAKFNAEKFGDDFNDQSLVVEPPSHDDSSISCASFPSFDQSSTHLGNVTESGYQINPPTLDELSEAMSSRLSTSPSMQMAQEMDGMPTVVPRSRSGSVSSQVSGSARSVNMANLGPYRPIYKHWFFSQTGAHGKAKWVPTTMTDSLALETAFMDPSYDGRLISTDGGRHDVDIRARRRKAVYWSADESDVRRCSWFYKTIDCRFVPFEEDVAELLEQEYRTAYEAKQWQRKVALPNGEMVHFHDANVMVHVVPGSSSSDWAAAASPTTMKRVVKRGVDEFNIEDGEPEKIDHVLFMVHGIGAACDLKFRSVEEVVDEFREIAHQMVQSHYRSSYDSGEIGRIEVLPISWHSELHSEESGIDAKLKAITLESIPKIRSLANETILDVLFYTSPKFCQHIMEIVSGSLNRLYTMFCHRNPSFTGGISLAGHSLGSLILFDLLSHQKAEPENRENLKAGEGGNATGGEKDGQPTNYMMGHAGTGQPFISYPQLLFNVKNFFALGSPIGMFVTVRGIDTLGLDFKLPTCDRFFNIFHPYDPVAYRIESLVNGDCCSLQPVLIPHHKGRKRMHLELRETMERVKGDLKARIINTFKSTLETVTHFKGFTKTDPASIASEVDKVLDEQLQMNGSGPSTSTTGGEAPATPNPSTATNSDVDQGETELSLGLLNQGRRIDYVLQEAPLEFFNGYLFALTSHVCYWESEDTTLFVVKEIYSSMGVRTDSKIPQHSLTIERPTN